MDKATTERDIEVIDLEGKDLTFHSGSVKLELRKYWDREHINKVIERIENPRDKMFAIFMWMSGVRITEAISLTKEKINFRDYMMTVKWLKSRKYHERVVPLHPTLKSVLEVYTGMMKAEDRVFPFSRQRGWQLIKKHFNGHPHQMRHSFAVNWLRCGGDIVTLHRILGHSKLQTTMEYLKLVPIDQAKELIKIKFT